MATKIKQILIILIIGIIVAGGFILAGSLTPSTDTDTPTMYTVNDFYNLIVNNSTTTTSTHTVSTTTTPIATSSHSISEIYARLANLIKKDKLKTGTTYLGVTGDYGVTDERADVPIIYSSLSTTSDPTSSGYTLIDIYNLITNNATTTAGSHSVSTTTSPASSMYSLSSLYTSLSSLIIANTVATGTTYLGVVGTLDVPGAPTIGTATAGDAQATVTFTAPLLDGGETIDYYTASSSPDGINVSTTSTSTVVVTGLTNDTPYTFTVYAHSAIGTSTASASSNEVTPTAEVDLGLGLVAHYKMNDNATNTQSFVVTSGTLSANILVVGGGGSGNIGKFWTYYGMGGGGGEVKEYTGVSVSGNTDVVIGLGGVALTSDELDRDGNQGGDSSFGDKVAGGGYGGRYDDGIGGSSGGNIFSGGNPNGSAGGGGAGAGENGHDAISGKGGDGGDGANSSISGNPTYYGGGGGGSADSNAPNSNGAGGNGGGGDGAISPLGVESGEANTGGGGGAGTYMNYNSGAGGSGIVVVRYLTSSGTATGGTITYDGDYTVHTFYAPTNLKTVVDSKGSNNGTATRATSLLHADGKIGGAFSFDGATHADNVDTYLFLNGVPISYGAWVYVNVNTTNCVLCSQALGFQGWSVTSQEQYYIYGGGSYYGTGIAPTVGAWTHVFVTVDADGHMIFYLNGTPHDMGYSNGDYSNADSWKFGNPPGLNPLDGLIDDVRIYSRALTQNDINTIYNSGAGTEEE